MVAAALGNTDARGRQPDRAGAARHRGEADGRRRRSTSRSRWPSIDEHRMHDYPVVRDRLRRRRPARCASRRAPKRRRGTSRRRCEPVHSSRSQCRSSWCGVRLQLAKVYWAIGEHTAGLSFAARDRRCSAPSARTRHTRRRGLGASPCHHRELAKSPSTGAAPLTAAELRPLLVPADPPHHPRHRRTGCSCPATRSTPRSARSIASWASHRVTKPCNERPQLVSSAGRQASPGELGLDVVGVGAERQGQLRAAVTTRGSPTMGRTPISTSTISAAVAPALTAASACAP